MAITPLVNFSPDCFLPTATTGPAQKNDATTLRPFLAYDDTTAESAVSKSFFLGAYTGTLKLRVAIATESATSGNAGFTAAVEAITSGDSIDLSTTDSFDSTNAGSTSVPGTAKYPKVIDITVSNVDSVAELDSVRIKLARDPAISGDCTGDVRVYGALLYSEA